MRTGIVVTARPGVEDVARRAEELGFSSFWVYDTPMVNGDPFVPLALCAKAARRIKLGIGVTSPALRSAPAAAAAVSSLNAIAPGRVICGVGTGNTARRTLGMAPTKMVELDAFTEALQNLTAGRETQYTEGNRTRTIKFLHVGRYVNIEDPVEFVVAAFGLNAAAIAGRRGAGVISFGLLAPDAWTSFEQARRAAACDAGQPEAAECYVMTSLHVLADGEDRYGALARDSMGHVALALLTFAADNRAFGDSLGLVITSSNCFKAGIDAVKAGQLYGTATEDPVTIAKQTATYVVKYLSGLNPPRTETVQENRITATDVGKFAAQCSHA
ncbi:MAG TPA: LLM class flavin-dependent oxidoreductase [Jatrophihabitantaceae bacterium]|jgi:alkanesulfonate monooxygenase SsuD/methylene tetrahydromethanopterin reductase-like flavin-dependent oxidoreductase (luciferase family)|nr:LLM class flavin-dependent oxidoreductase [Jatrophihabitantaceae bacterium]